MHAGLLGLAALVALSQVQARPPLEKLKRGFSSLSNGTWEGAFREWNEEGHLSASRLEEVRGKLARLGVEARAIGEWTAFHPALVQPLWQRHWVLATFDQGAGYFAFDFQFHKGEWRLAGLEVTGNPAELVPNLDQKSLTLRLAESR